MESQLQRLIELQTEQNQLLKKHLVRIRFSLLTLLLLTTAVCCCLGYITYKLHAQNVMIVPAGNVAAPPTFLWHSTHSRAGQCSSHFITNLFALVLGTIAWLAHR